MNLKDSKLFMIKNTFKSKRNIFLILVLSFLLIILLSVLIFNHTILNYMNNYKTKNIDNRTLIAYRYNLEKINANEIEKINHVTDIIPNMYNSINIKSDEFSNIVLQAIGTEELNRLNIVSGSKELENGSIICPVNFVPIANANMRTDVNNENIINANNLIGKRFNVTLKKEQFINHEVNLLDSKQKNFQIIGTYLSENYVMDNNLCFTSVETIKDIVDFISIEDSGRINESYNVIVDNIDNIEEVKNEIKNLNIEVKEKIVLDFSTIAIVGVISVSILIFAISMIIITIHLNIKRDLSNKVQEILLYRSLGFEKKSIKQMFLLQYFLIFFISSIIALVVLLIVFNILKSYLENFMLFRLIPLVFNYIEYIIIITVGIVLPNMITNNQINKILATNKIK